MYTRNSVVCGMVFSTIAGMTEASGPLRPCLHLADRPEIYAISNGSLSFVFLDNAYNTHDRNQMRSAFMSEGALTGIQPLIIRNTMVIDTSTPPVYPWHWGEAGYSMWIQEEFVCTREKPPVYDLTRQQYRDPVF